ncbi:hypothetical protein CORC01_01545 [Colletotrichum orchidophilum]|uniref:Uncharacterized protein n=1 Tax=Colletotrichum orchidophilum TaxID=1209926 RepID=A0A1G4BNY1_9PEZI|nr:uncharacterized protein CORC01_01545 [Colletotrichum orchidophilum]OHF03161.1 hypothetical protein CORC01_01545 [Colletotrichum orchidophilum]
MLRRRKRVRQGIKCLEQSIQEEAQYRGLIMELEQILRDHYVIRYLNCRAKDLPALDIRFGVGRYIPQEIADA